MADNSTTIEFICRDNSKRKLVAHTNITAESNVIRKKILEESLGVKCQAEGTIDLSWRQEGSSKGCSDHCTFIVEDNPFHDILLGRLACEDLDDIRDRGSYPLGRPQPLSPG